MKPISQEQIESLFKDTDIKLSMLKYNNMNYCTLYKGDQGLVCMRGECQEPQIYDKISFTGRNRITEEVQPDTKKICRVIFSCLPKDKRDKIFDVLELEPCSESEISQFQKEQQYVQRLTQMLSLKPTYGKFDDKQSVFFVSMREYLVLQKTQNEEVIGTDGLGPCIGVAIVAKNNQKVQKVGLTHIDALTKLESLTSFLNNIGQAETFDIVMVSSQNAVGRAVEILKYILQHIEEGIEINVMSELNGSTSFAVNTLTGEIYKNIPAKAFVKDHELSTLESMALMMPGPIKKSPLYDEEKRKKIIERTCFKPGYTQEKSM